MSNIKERKYIDFIQEKFNSNIFNYNQIRGLFIEQFGVSKNTYNKYYLLAKESYSDKLDVVNKEVFEKEIELKKEQMQNNFKTKNELISDLEAEINQIIETIKRGYIVKQVEIEGGMIERKEVFGTKEYEAWNRVLKDKRESLIRLQGYYAPDKLDLNNNVGLIDVYVD